MSEDYSKIKLRVKTIEEAIQILTRMALRADERMDDFDASFNNLTVKVEALVDAQIRLAEAQIRIEETLSAKVEALVAAQIRTEETLSANIEILTATQIRTEESLTRLTEAQASTDKRLNALIDIVREDREGRNGK